MIDLNQSIQYIKGVGPQRGDFVAKIKYIYIRRFNYILS